MFEVRLVTKAKKELEELEENLKNKIYKLLKTLERDPIPARIYDVKKLIGMKDMYRIRIGKVRIVYIIDWKDKIISVVRIGFRGKVYEGV
jgi:mRNA interferase RelE/StbE